MKATEVQFDVIVRNGYSLAVDYHNKKPSCRTKMEEDRYTTNKGNKQQFQIRPACKRI